MDELASTLAFTPRALRALPQRTIASYPIADGKVTGVTDVMGGVAKNSASHIQLCICRDISNHQTVESAQRDHVQCAS